MDRSLSPRYVPDDKPVEDTNKVWLCLWVQRQTIEAHKKLFSNETTHKKNYQVKYS